jgi:hypothetical protein
MILLMHASVYVFHHGFSYCCLSGNMFTESLLGNGFAYPYYNMYMFYSVDNKPLSSQYVLFINSAKVTYPRIKRVLEITDSFQQQTVSFSIALTFSSLCACTIADISIKKHRQPYNHSSRMAVHMISCTRIMMCGVINS